MIACSTPKIHGHYDFFTGLITLDKFTENELSLVKLALSKSPPPLNTPQAIELRDIRALVKHEITHFLDHTTTIWGLEFLYRRSRLIQALKHGEADIKQCLDVYLLNAAELQMHEDLVKVHKNIAFNQCDTIKHELVYEKHHGAVVIIKFFHSGTLVCDVPLSLLSLLEANAIANEYFARLDDLVHMDPENKNVAEAAVERRLQKILNEPSLVEYSVLINLAQIHFTFLDTRQLLSYVGVLVNFCLNSTMFSLGAISEFIRHSFNNKQIGNGIWADLCRGMSRHLIAFKTILFMHAWIELAPAEKKDILIETMSSDPYHAIEMFWDEQGRYDPMGSEFEISAILKNLKEISYAEDFSVVSQAITKNDKWRQQKNLKNCQFEEIACLDILLGDDSLVSCPQSINFDVLSHSYGVIEAYIEFDNLTGDSVRKFHMPLQQASAMLESILTRKEAAQTRTHLAGTTGFKTSISDG